MNLATIQQNINARMAETADLQPELFKEILYCAYRTQLLKQLQKCKSAEAFKQALANNWLLVKGNALCYTARPHDPLTKLLCDIAEEISKELQITKLTIVEKLKVAPICLLMPGVVTESIYSKEDSAYVDYPNLTDLRLDQVLKTHILSESGRHLIAVRTLLELPGPWEANGKSLPMHYIDFTGMAEQYYVTVPELNRLRRHSSHTEALFAAKEDYEALLNDAGFLSHLQILIKGLCFNSISGIGSEESAGQGAYAALENFTRYYTALGEVAQQIPVELKAALDELINISSDYDKHRTATINQSCINIRHQALSKLVQDNQIKLADIGVDSVHKGQLLETAQKRFADNKHALKAQLAEVPPAYTGQDALALTDTLLTTYGVTPAITSLRALQDFLTLSREEMEQIAERNDAVKKGIVAQFPTLEALVHFCLTTPLEPLESIIAIMGELLVEKLIATPEDISASLMLMEGPRLTLMMQLLTKRLPTIIQSGKNFGRVLKLLSPEQRDAVYEAFKLELPTIIENANDFGKAVRYLSPDKYSAICKTLIAKIPVIFITGGDLAQALRYLNSEQANAICDALKTHLQSIIKSGDDFGTALKVLNPEQRTAVYEAFKAQLSTIIEIDNDYDFGFALEYLSAEQCAEVCELLKAKMPTLIKNSADFGRALLDLGREQCSIVCKALKMQLPTVIITGDDFGQVLQYLNTEQRSAVYETFKTQFPTLIKSGNDLVKALKPLKAEQRMEVFYSLKAHLREKVNYGTDLLNLPDWLASEECLNVLGCSADEKQALRAEIDTLLESANQKRNKSFCPNFEMQKRSFSEMQETVENGLQNMQLDQARSDKVMRLQ